MKENKNIDQLYLKKAMRLARKGAGYTSPNPLVGAFVVKNGEVFGRGFHRQFGGPHAEVFALQEAKENAAGSTLYVNLEPCVHFGNTPPCVDRIIETGISKVVISNRDPNPLVNGSGIRRLREAGIEVNLSVCEREGLILNEAYFTAMSKNRPFVILKWAQSIDGKITGQNKKSAWISNEKSRKAVHKLRKEVDAILVGAGTVNHDNPQLTVRSVKGAQPWRLILSRKLSVNRKSQLFNDEFVSKTAIFTLEKKTEKRNYFQDKGVQVILLEPDRNGDADLSQILSWMMEKQLISLLVEGGKEVLTSFFTAGLVDKLMIFVAPKLFGRGIEAIGGPALGTGKDVIEPKLTKFRKVGSDILFEAYLSEIPCSQD